MHDKKRKEKKKKGMGFMFCTQLSKFLYTLCLKYKIFIYHAFRKTKTQLSYVSLEIDIAR